MSSDHGNNRLVVRRRRSRRRRFIVLVILLLLLLAAVIYGLRQSSVRISRVQVFGGDASLATYAKEAMQGKYLGIIPRDSIFFFPEARMRSDFLAAYPEVAAVSISRSGLSGLSIKIDTRVPLARWCGLAPTRGVDVYCYLFDAKGFVFAAAATTTQTINPFSVYAPLGGGTLEPLRATIAHAEKLPSVFDFARQLSAFGSPTTHIVFRDDEIDQYLASGTRITYVLGDEQNAFAALVSARDQMNIADGSIEYIDLRFSGKVYVKKALDVRR